MPFETNNPTRDGTRGSETVGTSDCTRSKCPSYSAVELQMLDRQNDRLGIFSVAMQSSLALERETVVMRFRYRSLILSIAPIPLVTPYLFCGIWYGLCC